ncbi:hypothetical protein [Flavobacterium sp.]|uniref:hypothetical protein n=1 Tax=Flavobacterium sp. TaxID=239 RepID=UPI002634B1C7|nr:hypothetical protein [Flavobacterium sp.]
MISVKPIEPVVPDPEQGLTICGLTIVQDKGDVVIATDNNEIFLIPSKEIINVIWAFENDFGDQYSTSELQRIFGVKDFESLKVNLTKKIREVRTCLENPKSAQTPVQATSNEQFVNEGVENVQPDDIPAYLNEVPVFGE